MSDTSATGLATDSRKAGARVGYNFDALVIDGGVPLKGTIEVLGAKNLVTKAMVASLLGETQSLLRDVPEI